MPLFFEVVRFLRPRYVLMENVPDMFKFVNGIYGRFSMSQLIELGYQGRIGFMPAGKYGVPQYRLRCFLWGALSGEPLPGFPMPSHRESDVLWKTTCQELRNPIKADTLRPRMRLCRGGPMPAARADGDENK